MVKITGPFKQIVTMAELPERGPLQTSHLEVLKDACICSENGRIRGLGSLASLKSEFPDADYEEIKGGVLLPGFIDAHTHICWAGNRAADLAMRLEGKTYLEIAEAGGGIWSSVQHSRAASMEELCQLIIERSDHQVNNGITTTEVKSGYGLGIDQELKMLKAIKMANDKSSGTLISTCLAAHMKPHDFNGSNRDYLEILVKDLFPKLRAEELTGRIDIFIESSAFDKADATYYLNAAKKAGFSITVHSDQFSTGGSSVAINMGAVSADHLEASTEFEIEALATSNTIAVALPGASIGLGMNFTPARKLLDAGCCLAIASDWNPGSAPMGELLLQACILGIYEKLSMAEILSAITNRAASALELSDRGSLELGKVADMQSYDVDDFREIIYNQGRIRPEKVWIGGNRIH